MKGKVMNYEKRESIAVDAIKKQISEKFKSNRVDFNTPFVELYKNDNVHPNHYAFSTVDGVGSKVLIAQLMNKYDTVGIDCVAMNANDAATVGPIQPFLYTVYLACQDKIEQEKAGDITKGTIYGLEQCSSVNLGKGETASLDEIISGVLPGYGFDLAGSMFGYVEKAKVSHREPVIGDIIIGFQSSGLHSNGFTAARHMLLNGDFESRPQFKEEYKGQYSIEDRPIEGKKLGDILLEPTKIYVRPMAAIAAEVPEVIGVNITGYGLKNFNRKGKDIMYRIKEPFEPQPIFKLIQDESKFSTKKMYTKFNMGMGSAAIVPRDKADQVVNIARNNGVNAKIVGVVIPGKGEPITNLHKDGHLIPFPGYG